MRFTQCYKKFMFHWMQSSPRRVNSAFFLVLIVSLSCFKGYGHYLVPSEEMTVAVSNHEYSSTQQQSFIDVVFSDLDGTLIHYPENIDELERNEEKRHFIKLPPSSTGLKGSLQASNTLSGECFYPTLSLGVM
jgi:hypothetical protein